MNIANFRVPLLILHGVYLSNSFDWCSVSSCAAGPANHVMCTKRDGSNCDKIKDLMSDTRRHQLLHFHHDVRNQWALGKYKKQPQLGFPKAANMKMMKYDKELEKLAKQHIYGCYDDHDLCRDVDRWMVGQNIQDVFNDRSWPGDPHVEHWLDREYDNLPVAHIAKMTGTGDKKTGHLTQAVWANSEYVGCWESQYYNKSGRMYWKRVTCNYGPGGNWIGYPVYKAGEPCSECEPGMSCSSKKYPALCTDGKGESIFDGASSLKVSLLSYTLISAILISMINA